LAGNAYLDPGRTPEPDLAVRNPATGHRVRLEAITQNRYSMAMTVMGKTVSAAQAGKPTARAIIIAIKKKRHRIQNQPNDNGQSPQSENKKINGSRTY
jgi:thiamine biosynthesis lipoprotein ApbE